MIPGPNSLALDRYGQNGETQDSLEIHLLEFGNVDKSGVPPLEGRREPDRHALAKRIAQTGDRLQAGGERGRKAFPASAVHDSCL
jgi:hypothetical protein